MAKIYSAPESIELPNIPFTNSWVEHEAADKKYLDELRELVLSQHTGDYVGEIYRTPMGDGYAQYMVVSIKPLKMIHIPLGDAWDSPHVHNLKGSDVTTSIDGEKRMAKLFGGSK